jgi:hypothetical protein
MIPNQKGVELYPSNIAWCPSAGAQPSADDLILYNIFFFFFLFPRILLLFAGDSRLTDLDGDQKKKK